MTHNQIEYWKLREEQRSNQAKEQETERSNRANEGINEARRIEEGRHNLESENLNRLSLEETARHNTATEGETIRSNIAKENLSKYQTDTNAAVGFNAASLGLEGTSLMVAENMRHNMEMEAYNQESLEKDYLIRSVQNQIKAKELGIKMTEAEIKSGELAETRRHQQVVEAETERANKMRERQKNYELILGGVQAYSSLVNAKANAKAAKSKVSSALMNDRMRTVSTVIQAVPILSGL